ncbi:MAG: carboxypeptidase-like regulatory domain-containing protein, partial [Prevotella sp.]|nr:carboxypeptidase-like regulatory domain-containing protein [Prevotella sp.]
MKKNKLFYICLVLLMSIVSLNASAQTTVKGTVVDEAGEPIIGATVQVKGTTTGTITDFDGNFTISVPAKSKLVVSFIGYISQTITDMSKAAKVVLKEDAQMIEEV